MRIRCYSTGRVRSKRGARGARRYVVDDWSEQTLPVNVFLIEHPAGLCLVDAGQEAAATTRGYFPWWHPFMRLSRFELDSSDEIAAQLAEDGIDPRSIRWVVLTHLHTDHAGGLHGLSGAEVVVARAEWERAQGWRGKVRGYLPDRWPRELEPHLVDLDGPPVDGFAASHDLAGDGTLLLVPLPGHTPTHIGLLARDDDRGYLFVGDAAHTAAELRTVEPELARRCTDAGLVVLAAHEDVDWRFVRP